MHLSITSTAIILAHLGATVGESLPTILADTNRDGVVNDADAASKTSWSRSRGAIFLPNVGDSLHRCAVKDLVGNPLSNHEMASCHDASGHLLFEPSYVAPLKTLPIDDVASEAYAHIYVTPEAAATRVRLFLNEVPSQPANTSSWRLLDPEHQFNSSQIKAGIPLGIDGREFVTDVTKWDGKATVHFDLYFNTTILSDAVELKVAPVLVHHHLQRVETLLSTAGNDTEPRQVEFLRQLDEGRKAAGLETPLFLFNQSDDIWAQDFVEPAYASMPGPNGPVSIRIMLRSDQGTRAAGRQVFEMMRGKGVGAYQPEGGRGGYGHRDIDAFGNLETIPPYTSKSGVKYPAGRLIHGRHFEKLPASAMNTFLSGQELQQPLFLEAGFLLVGHVDEFVQFVPSNKTGLGFTIAITDTVSAIEGLRNASVAGHGNVPVLSYNGSVEGAISITPEELKMTINELLANETFHKLNAYAQKHINANLEVLLSEIPIKREDVIRVPGLFKSPGDAINVGESSASDGMPGTWETVMENEHLLVSFSPSAINGVVIGKHYLCPKPWGPIVEGKDLFDVQVRAAYARAEMDVTYVDDFMTHHVNFGEVHCGSNTIRAMDGMWWE
ncbi:hypothetical protein CMEL01_16374 [Colletotrichum melonis]|uniref:Protein-arginine deiminase C-terminal domain-containing protein n=1 Tax=Colletotrichum melonis TaxID=1209925 RepID=A0AAI9UHP0_9PEZI|nr:hypothetical protein CMEL01_16374 [Colletotrichum melonis]